LRRGDASPLGAPALPETGRSMSAAAAAGVEQASRRIDVTGMVDRADDDVAAGREDGHDDQESEVAHGGTIAAANGAAPHNSARMSPSLSLRNRRAPALVPRPQRTACLV
jgi:hypothetical protein